MSFTIYGLRIGIENGSGCASGNKRTKCYGLSGGLIDDTQTRAWQVPKRGGLLASLVQFPSPETAASYVVRGTMVSAEECGTETLTEIGRLIDSGKIRPVVSSVHQLDEIRAAHAKSESRHVRGKIILQVADM